MKDTQYRMAGNSDQDNLHQAQFNRFSYTMDKLINTGHSCTLISRPSLLLFLLHLIKTHPAAASIEPLVTELIGSLTATKALSLPPQNFLHTEKFHPHTYTSDVKQTFLNVLRELKVHMELFQKDSSIWARIEPAVTRVLVPLKSSVV